MRQLIAGNWKMHGLSADAVALARAVRDGAGGVDADLLVCPPFLHIPAVAAALAGGPEGSTVALGAQDCHQAAQGAHTGDVSAPMLVDAGVTHVILGHSERRQNHHEIDEVVREKTEAALRCGLAPIVCVGETDAQRNAGQETEVVGWQLAGSLPQGFADPRKDGLSCAVAYEPVWAIGTGRTPTLEEVATMHAFIREELVRQFGAAGHGIRILYGGSVKPANAKELLAVPHVGGALVGGASLKAEDFLAIARAARDLGDEVRTPGPWG
ncbi:MAG: triose-phosphate isomerase [Proteobacteria bacterium]|nr:triose-phosphate isomerase [Pseudomonadota bacterium]